VHYPRRRSTAAPVPSYTLAYGDLTMVVDEARLPGRLRRLIPPAHGSKPPETWRPFCTLAVAMGLMR
jgi:hypothetical protein